MKTADRVWVVGTGLIIVVLTVTAIFVRLGGSRWTSADPDAGSVTRSISTPDRFVRYYDEQGRSYTSTGVVLDRVEPGGTVVQVRIRETMGKRYRTTFLSLGGAVLGVSTRNPAAFSIGPEHRYVRVHVECNDGTFAWTEPIDTGAMADVADAAASTETPAVAEAVKRVFDQRVVEGTIIEIVGPPSEKRLCDIEPENTARAGEALLASRRAVAGGAFADARAHWVLSDSSQTSISDVARAARQRFDEMILAYTPLPPLQRIDINHFTYVYPAGYDGNRDSIRVSVRLLTVRTLNPLGATRDLSAYLLNYDKIDPVLQAIVFVMPGGTPVATALGAYDRGGYSGAALGRLAMRGLPILTFDERDSGGTSPPEAWEHSLLVAVSDIRLLDHFLLGQVARVDLLGGCAQISSLLAFHESRPGSAYVAGQCIPLWTRNDTRARTGGPFGSDSDTDHLVFQSRFQWADFLLMAAQDGVDLAFALNTGGSGLGKAGVFTEVLPALRRFNVPYQVRGDDRDGDGRSEASRPLCNEYDIRDYLDFLDWSRSRRATPPARP